MTGEPSLCIKGCGFFSTPETNNLCSKCYNDFLKDESARDHTETAPEATEKERALEEAEETTAPSLCIKGCGFFSTSESKNMCSTCYNDVLKDESARYLATIRDHTETAPEAAEKATVLEEAVVAKKKKESSRCKACKKKVGILGFHCRCGHVFCGSHRYPEEHSCSWDYKSAAINDLVIQNPIIKGDKVSRI